MTVQDKASDVGILTCSGAPSFAFLIYSPEMPSFWSLCHALLSKSRLSFLTKKKTLVMNTRRSVQGCHALALWARKILNLQCQTRCGVVVLGILPASMSDRHFALCQQVPWQKWEMLIFLARIRDHFPPYFCPSECLTSSFSAYQSLNVLKALVI